MNWLRHAVGDTKAHAYAPHVQRLIVIGNFALLAGLHPDDVDEWYLIVSAAAYQRVEMPNVRGCPFNVLYWDFLARIDGSELV